MHSNNIKLIELAEHPEFLPALKTLLLEYGKYMYSELGLVAGKDSFYEELKILPTPNYQPQNGTFIIALIENTTAGCVAVKKFNEGSCEMKRMYIRPTCRRMGIGKLFCEYVIKWSRNAGYSNVLLDTNEEMTEAISLYRKYGFADISPYCVNENDHPVFMEYIL